jgi:hypothetical protein
MLVTGLQRLTAVLLALVAILLFPLAVWVGSGVNVVLSPETYKDGLASQNIYADIVPVALPAFAEAMLTDNETQLRLAQIARALPADKWRDIANQLVPPEWLKGQMEQGLDSFFLWLDSDEPTFTRTIDFSVVSEHLTGEGGQTAAREIVEALPPCTSEQLNTLAAAGDNPDSEIPLCQPPSDTAQVMQTSIAGMLGDMADMMRVYHPMVADMFREDTSGQAEFVRQSQDNALHKLRLSVRAYEQLVGLFYLCPAGIMALMVIIVVRSLRGFGRWIGWTSIVSGFVALVPLVLIPLLIVDTLTLSLAAEASSAPEIRLFQTRLASGFLVSAFDQFKEPVLVQAGIFILFGIVLLIIASVSRKTPQLAPIDEEMPSTASARRTVVLPKDTQPPARV